MSDLLWYPVIPWPLLIVAALAAIAGVAWSLVRGVRSRTRVVCLGAFRLLMLATLMLILFQPQLRHDEVTVLRPQLAVLVDTSESMTDPVDDHQPRRAQEVQEWFKSKALERAKKDFDVRIFTFDSSLNEQSQNPDQFKFVGNVSNVVDAANQVSERFRGQPLAGVLLLTDGLDTSGAAEAVSSKTPVYTFELENSFTPKQRAKRISLANVDYPPRVVVGWDTEIRVSLAGIGMGGQTVPVELWRNGTKQAESQVAFNEDDQTRQATFAVSDDKPGAVQYELRVKDPAADKEARSYPFIIEVMEPGNRVIYVQNTLGFDFKFLRKAIMSDRNLQLNAFVRWADGRLASLNDNGAEAGSVDFTPQALANSAVVILGDLTPDALSPANCSAIRDFVDHGGGLVLLGGSNLFAETGLAKTALAPLLPIKVPAPYHEGNFPVQITDTGLHHPVFGPLFAQVKNFPPLLTYNETAGAAPSAEVLMQVVNGGVSHPLIVASRFGQGRVVVVLTDTMWRWRLAAPGWSQERSPHDTFWTQLMDWLIPKEQGRQNSSRIQLFTERTNYISGERPEVRAIIQTPSPDAAPPATLPLQVHTPDEKVFDYTMKAATFQTQNGKKVSGYTVQVDPDGTGVYSAKSALKIGGEDAEGETRFIVSRPATELTGKPIDRDLLKRIAANSGGKYYTMADWDAWRGDLHYQEQHFSRMQLLDLWNHPFLLGFLMLLFIAEWITRKLWNLP
ncbi:MAG TPA: glutamine amidotransferase [Chthoniobacteraceae bacterium]|nr:glutamine amidotransferase [Chthoniobacteraceae bacterium]